MKDERSARPLNAVVIGIGSLFLLVPALVNGFPLVYSDTGTYLRSAFDGYIPPDRPYWYGALIRYAGLNGCWLWGVVVLQAMACALYVRALIAGALPGPQARIVFLVFCAIAGPFTGLGWYAGQLMPDILTPVGGMAVFLLLTGERTWRERTVHASVIAICSWCHSSNLLILPITGMGVILFTALMERGRWKRMLLRLSIVTVCASGGLYLANGLIDDRPYLTRGSQAFLMGRLVDLHMLEPLLREECGAHQWRICAHVDSLPRTGQEFLWYASSPLNELGGWDATREEFGEVVRASFSTPDRIRVHVCGSLRTTGELLTHWRLGRDIVSRWYRDPGSPPAAMLAAHVPNALASFHAALQQGGRGELSVTWPDRGYLAVMVISVAALAFWALRLRRNRDRGAVSIVLLVLIIILVDAWVCASFSAVEERYLARVGWLLPLAATVVGARCFTARA